MRELTPTSFALLALLGVRAWSAYELTKQVDRTFRWYWPRKDSIVYEEVKKLVEHGLARSQRSATGRRPRTVYTITPRGRSALKQWLREPGTGPELNFQALIKVSFADLGSRADLLGTLGAVHRHADAMRDEALRRGADYARTGGAYPERLHVIALTTKFLVEFWNLVAEWATWAGDEVETWPQTRSGAGVTVPNDAFLPPRKWSKRRR